MQKSGFAITVVTCAVLALGACQQEQEQALSASPTGFDAVAVGPAGITRDAAALSVTRNDAGRIGVMIVPSAQQVSFTVEGEAEDLRVFARVGSAWVHFPEAEEYSVMIGRGGASQIRVDSRDAEAIQVRVTGVVDCATAAVGVCVPLAAQEEEAEPEN